MKKMFIFSELKQNPGLLPKLVILIYRFGYMIHFYIKIPILRQLLYILYRLIDLIFLKIFLNCDIPGSTKIGKRLRIYHPYGIIINSASIIGDDFLIRAETTIGNKGTSNGCPIIGNNVQVGVGARIIGNISIGSGCQIGANAVVTKSFEENSILVGIPAHNIRKAK